MLNRTVSDARLSLLPSRVSATRFIIACLRDGRPVPFALHGSGVRLFIEHEVDVDNGTAHTASYTYTLQAAQQRDSWLVRWEYLRDRPTNYPYPLGHVHVNADFAATEQRMAAKPLARLHLPSGRVAIELVLRHVVAEWGAQPKSRHWSEILDDSLAGFEDRRSAP